MRTAPTATQRDDHAGLSLDLGVSGPRPSHIAARIGLNSRHERMVRGTRSDWCELDEDIWPQPRVLARAHRFPAT